MSPADMLEAWGAKPKVPLGNKILKRLPQLVGRESRESHTDARAPSGGTRTFELDGSDGGVALKATELCALRW